MNAIILIVVFVVFGIILSMIYRHGSEDERKEIENEAYRKMMEIEGKARRNAKKHAEDLRSRRANVSDYVRKHIEQQKNNPANTDTSRK